LILLLNFIAPAQAQATTYELVCDSGKISLLPNIISSTCLTKFQAALLSSAELSSEPIALHEAMSWNPRQLSTTTKIVRGGLQR
jgi:hypothetical protein